MAATLSAKRAFVGASAPSRRTAVRVSCSKQGDNLVGKVQAVAAVVAAAALLGASPVSAKVIIEQPQLKKLFQEEVSNTAAPVKREFRKLGSKVQQATQEAPKPKAPEVSTSGGINPLSVALPLAVVGIAGGAAALNAVDDEFGEFITKTSCKDSNTDGAGYEIEMKDTFNKNSNGARKPAPKPVAKAVAAAKTGTKKVKAATKGSGTTSIPSPLSSLFGDK